MLLRIKMDKNTLVNNLEIIIILLIFPFLALISRIYYGIEWDYYLKVIMGFIFIYLIYSYLFLMYFSHLYVKLYKIKLWKKYRKKILRWVKMYLIFEGIFIILFGLILYLFFPNIYYPILVFVIAYTIYRTIIQKKLQDIFH